MNVAQLPASRQPVTERGPAGDLLFSRTWFLFFQNVAQRVGNSAAAPSAVTVTGSPFSYTATDSGILIVTGGTVSLIEYGRDGTYTATGVTAGPIPVFDGDVIRVTYTVAPTLTWVRK